MHVVHFHSDTSSHYVFLQCRQPYAQSCGSFALFRKLVDTVLQRLFLAFLSKKVIIPLATTLGLILIWELLVDSSIIPNFLLPAPTQVLSALIRDRALLFAHSITTLSEACIGLVLGCILGLLVALIMDSSRIACLALNPLITISQTIPTIAIAPVLVLWLGYDLLPKVVLVIITTFFPITLSLLAGFRAVDRQTIDLMRILKASRAQMFYHVKLPSALNQFFGGLSISATYAIIAAVIAEWLGGFSGLGVYMIRVRKSFAYDRMFAVILLISVLSLLLMGLIRILWHVSMPWEKAERK